MGLLQEEIRINDARMTVCGEVRHTDHVLPLPTRRPQRPGSFRAPQPRASPGLVNVLRRTLSSTGRNLLRHASHRSRTTKNGRIKPRPTVATCGYGIPIASFSAVAPRFQWFRVRGRGFARLVV